MSIPFAPDFTLAYGWAYAYAGTISTDTTTDGTAFDTNLYEGPVHMVAIIGNSGDASTTIDLKVTQCATSGGSYSVVTGATKSLSASATANDNTVHVIKVDNWSSRYLKSRVVTAGGGTPSVPVHILFFAKKKIAGGSGIKTDG